MSLVVTEVDTITLRRRHPRTAHTATRVPAAPLASPSAAASVYKLITRKAEVGLPWAERQPAEPSHTGCPPALIPEGPPPPLALFGAGSAAGVARAVIDSGLPPRPSPSPAQASRAGPRQGMESN